MATISDKRKEFLIDLDILKRISQALLAYGALCLFLIYICINNDYLLHSKPYFLLIIPAAFFLLVAAHAVVFSTRFTGPAYRFVKSVRRILDGDFDFSVYLRDKDYLRNVEIALNDLLAYLNETVGHTRSYHEEVRDGVTSLVEEIRAGAVSPDETVARLERLLRRVSAFEEFIGSFKVAEAPAEDKVVADRVPTPGGGSPVAVPEEAPRT